MLGEGRQMQLWVVGQALIQHAQEIETVLWVVFPGILAIENDGHDCTGRRAQALDVLQMGNEIVDGARCFPGLVGKADQIRQTVVAKEATQVVIG